MTDDVNITRHHIDGIAALELSASFVFAGMVLRAGRHDTMAALLLAYYAIITGRNFENVEEWYPQAKAFVEAMSQHATILLAPPAGQVS